MRDMLKLATLIDNPGEPPAQTQYRDARVLAGLGYNALAIYETTAFAGIQNIETIDSAELRNWLVGRAEQITHSIDEAHAAGLGVYFFYDLLALPHDLVQADAADLTCRNRPQVLCPASDAAMDLSVAALETMLARWPAVQGVVLRFGDTDANRLPHLMGNDIYSPHCPRCSHMGPADRIIAVLDRFYELVVVRLNKRLIARAWNVRPHGLHDSVQLAEQVVPRLPGSSDDPRLMLSFKFTQTDFWRYQKWNPSSLHCGGRPILYELQCQREFEGKGGVPNWQAPLWRDGYPETRGQTDAAGLTALAGKLNIAGLWAWVRGGGWGGPFISNEAWIDANVFAVPRLADDPAIDMRDLARQWIDQRLNLADDAAVQPLVDLLLDSPEMVRQAFYIAPAARQRSEPWNPNGGWIQDDLLDAQAAWRLIEKLTDAQLDEAIREKQAAAEQISRARGVIQQTLNNRNQAQLNPLVNTLVYTESLFEMLGDFVTGLAAYRKYQRHHNPGSAQIARQKLLAAQTCWNHHTQHHGSLPGAATALRQTDFWELTQQILSELT